MRELGTAEQAVEWVMMAQGNQSREANHTLAPELEEGRSCTRSDWLLRDGSWEMGNSFQGHNTWTNNVSCFIFLGPEKREKIETES